MDSGLGTKKMAKDTLEEAGGGMELRTLIHR